LDIPTFVPALGSIILVNIVLSGDNAVVIALAARSLPPHQQGKAIFWGSAAAIVLRVVLTLVAVELLRLPYLKLIGGGLLFYIGVSLLLDDDGHADGGAKAGGMGLAAAVRTILVADLVMSLDNVIAVAAAAKGSVMLLILGLGLSIPLIIFGSTLLLTVMERYPIIITGGAALLGWLAGDMVISDPVVAGWFGPVSHLVEIGVACAGAVAVVLVAGWVRRRSSGNANKAAGS
jgi:YjbE family integral membrane protein